MDKTGAAEPYNELWGLPDLAFGVLVVPIKLRLGTGDDRNTAFTTDVSLAGALDMSRPFRGSSNWRLHVPIFAGVGAVDIEPRESRLMESRNVPALSLGIGLGISGYGGGAGVVVGWDIINGNSGDDSIGWDYQGRAWIGISIGATFGVTPATPDNAQD
jgi:hypothetical protein